MRTALIIIAFIALASAAPKVTKLGYRNLYKTPIAPPPHGLNPRIINGHEAKPHSIPFQAFLEVYALTEGWYCGGSLISENYVVTAGHCGDGGVQALVTLGAHKPQSAEDTQVQITSTDITVNKDYDADLIINDIAVIGLPSGVSLTDAIQPVKLAAAGNDFTGSTARASGWGLTDGNGNQISDVLNYVDLPVISNKDCSAIYGDLPDSIVCTSGNNAGTCSGDSGGPLVVDNALIGITSFGVIGCDTEYPSAFTRVTSFLSWLQSNTDVKVA